MNPASFEELFSVLPDSENPIQSSLHGTPCVIHDDHRWLLPIAHVAQAKGLLPKPCTLVMFDLHTDSNDPHCAAKLAAIRPNVSIESLVALCETDLAPLDDDWVKAGMELGMFGDAVIFGVASPREGSRESSSVYTNRSTSQEHHIQILSLPRSELLFQGKLSDELKSEQLRKLWGILGWKANATGFNFVEGLPPILLSIDLDCFAVWWSDYIFPWPDEVFETELLSLSGYGLASGWSGKRLLLSLAEKAGLVAIARESGCTGGPGKAAQILRKFNHYVFDGALDETQKVGVRGRSRMVEQLQKRGRETPARERRG